MAIEILVSDGLESPYSLSQIESVVRREGLRIGDSVSSLIKLKREGLIDLVSTRKGLLVYPEDKGLTLPETYPLPEVLSKSPPTPTMLTVLAYLAKMGGSSKGIERGTGLSAAGLATPISGLRDRGLIQYRLQKSGYVITPEGEKLVEEVRDKD